MKETMGGLVKARESLVELFGTEMKTAWSLELRSCSTLEIGSGGPKLLG